MYSSSPEAYTGLPLRNNIGTRIEGAGKVPAVLRPLLENVMVALDESDHGHLVGDKLLPSNNTTVDERFNTAKLHFPIS